MRLPLALLPIAVALIATAHAQQPAAQDPQTKADAAAQTPPGQAPAAAPASAGDLVPATENWINGSIDLGYLITGVHGNNQEFRSVVDERDGPRVLGLDFTLFDESKDFFDRFHGQAYGWGGSPYNTAHLDVARHDLYSFTFDYRDIAYFNGIPSFANPTAPAGFDQQSFDIHRRMLSVGLDLAPNRHITPYLAYTHNSGYGHGEDTWVDGSSNEYAVPTLLRDSTENYRGGLRFEYSRFHVTLEQGGTTYKDDDQAFDSTTNPGGTSAPVLGQTLSLTSLAQSYGIRGDSIYSKILLTANPTPWLDVYGQFLYSQPKTDVHFAEIAEGNLTLLSSLLFYNGQYTLGTGAANQPHTTGNVGFEVRPFRRMRIIESYMTDRYHDAASPLVAEQIFLTVNPTTSGPNLLNSLNYSQYVNYNQQQVDVFYDVSRKITLHGGYRFVWGDAQELASTLSPTELENGQLHRNIGLAGMTYRALEKLWINLDYEGSSSDNVYFRTSLNDYSKGRARVRYQFNNALTVQANFQVLNNQNPAPDIRYDFQSRDNSLSFTWTPAGSKRISVTGEYDRSTLRSNIDYLDLPFLNSAVSAYRDNAHTATSLVDLALPHAAKLTFGGSLFVSSGSRPSRYYQPLGRLSVPVQKHVYWNTEWTWYGYGEAFYLYEGFGAHVFTTGLKLLR
jgi:hypothetical protein